MDKNKLKRIGKITVKTFFGLLVMGALSIPFLPGNPKGQSNPLSHIEVSEFETSVTKAFTFEGEPIEQDLSSEELLSNMQEFVDTPEGGTSWRIFGETQQTPYTYTDEEGEQWAGVRPEFSGALKKLAGTEIIIQGYMFPLGQEEKQELFLLGPFPLSCPYHYHVKPNLIIEAHTNDPIAFSYDAVNIKGELELVPKDDDYNVFFRLKNVSLVQ